MRIPTLGDIRTFLLHRHAVKLVVVGHQKSGTTAVGALLARMVGGSFANDPLYECDWGRGQAVKEVVDNPEQLGRLVSEKRGLFCKTVLKDPDLTFLLPQCQRVFDKAQIVFVARDPVSTIRSIADRLDLSSKDLGQPADCVTLPNRHWRLILSSQLPEVGGTTVAEVLARRWSRAAREYLHHADRVHFIRYEDFIADRSHQLKDLLSELRMRKRNDAAHWLNHPFQPRGQAQTDITERIGARNLEIIESVCSETMERLDYSFDDHP
jgi:signal transduction histidine kinase